MPTSCSACSNRQKKGSGISFHSFPHDPVRRQKWVSAMGRHGWTPSIHASLCSVHFEEKCFDRTGQTVRLWDGSVPTVFFSPLNRRFKKARKLPGTSTESDVKQEKEYIEKVVLAKRQFEAKGDKLTDIQGLDVDDHTYPKRTHPVEPPQVDDREAHCFVCDKVTRNGTPLRCLTNTTKVHMHHKLDRLMTKELDVLVNEDEILCSRCARLLNYVDRIEVELATLNRSILNCIRGKHIQGLHHEELQSRIPDFNDSLSGLVSLFTGSEDDDCSIANFNTELVQQTSDINDKNSIDTDLTQKSFKCQACFFKTRYKSVMMYHLRQHLKSTYQSDVFNSSILEGTSHFPRANDDYEVEHLSVNKANNNVNTSISDVIEIHTFDDEVATVGNLLQDVGESGKISGETTNESEVEMKNHVLDSTSVEYMLEELHDTGQISAFINSDNDSVNCKVTSNSEASLDSNITSNNSLIKLEIMNVDEDENEVQVTAQGILCQDENFVNFGPVKSEIQVGSCQDTVVRRSTVSSGNVMDESVGSSNSQLECVKS